MTKQAFVLSQTKFWEDNSGSLGELKKGDFIKLCEKFYDDNTAMFATVTPTAKQTKYDVEHEVTAVNETRTPITEPRKR